MTYVPEQRRAPRHPKYDAIHRALLSGLLSNIGQKTETYEYQGPRGVRFLIFPGSSLFDQKPKWLMAAELVETTKLYARTCATVQPQWIERVAAHLVERTYAEPHWDPRTQSVVAYERVALYGLVLIPRRLVPYGPINPRVAREIFIQHALVLETLRTTAGFMWHNKALTEEVRGLEAKIRERNLLADAATRYAFYDARIPPDITNAAQFESWRKRSEREDPRRLYMDKADLLRADAPEITPENYPDRVDAGGLKLPLDYRYEPGEVHDGITLTVPLAALGQLRPQPYEWLVPGMLEEKIAALIRSLPGALRRNFVPVPDFARAAARDLAADPHQQGLLESLAAYLAKATGVPISPRDFHPDTLPDYLQMAFRIVDDTDTADRTHRTNRTLAIGRDLPALQQQFAHAAAESFARIPQSRLNREHITEWDFGDLPDVIHVPRHGLTIDAYPALVDAGASVSLRLFPAADLAANAHRAGLRRLFLLEHRRDIKYMLAYLPDVERLTLYFLQLGTVDELREQLSALIVDRALLIGRPTIRTQEQWQTRSREAAINLLDTADAVTALAGEILGLYHQVLLRLEEAVPEYPRPASDIHDQLVYLVSRTFFTITPWEWLEHYPRYLRGILLRLEKLANGNLARDLEHIAELTPWLNAYRARARGRHAAKHNPDLELFRWMLEEYRIHLFAQELHTPFPISARRLEKQWAKIGVT